MVPERGFDPITLISTGAGVIILVSTNQVLQWGPENISNKPEWQ